MNVSKAKINPMAAMIGSMCSLRVLNHTTERINPVRMVKIDALIIKIVI